MTGPQPTQHPPPANPALLPVLATATYLAALIALWGFTSLILDRDVIVEPDAGPLLGPAMAVAACAVTWVAIVRQRGAALGRALAAAASVYVVMLVVGAVGYMLTRGQLAWLVLFPGNHALSPFVIGAGLLSGVTVWSIAAFGRAGRR